MSEKPVDYARVRVLSKYRDMLDTRRTCDRLMRQANDAYTSALLAAYPDGGTVVACDVPEWVGCKVRWLTIRGGIPELELLRDGKPVPGFCVGVEDDFFRNMQVVPPMPPLGDDEPQTDYGVS